MSKPLKERVDCAVPIGMRTSPQDISAMKERLQILARTPIREIEVRARIF